MRLQRQTHAILLAMPCFGHNHRTKVKSTKARIRRFVRRLVCHLKPKSWTGSCERHGHRLKLVNVTDLPRAASEEDLSWTKKRARPAHPRQTKSTTSVPTRKTGVGESTETFVAANARPEVELRCDRCGRRAQDLGWAVKGKQGKRESVAMMRAMTPVHGTVRPRLMP